MSAAAAQVLKEYSMPNPNKAFIDQIDRSGTTTTPKNTISSIDSTKLDTVLSVINKYIVYLSRYLYAMLKNAAISTT